MLKLGGSCFLYYGKFPPKKMLKNSFLKKIWFGAPFMMRCELTPLALLIKFQAEMIFWRTSVFRLNLDLIITIIQIYSRCKSKICDIFTIYRQFFRTIVCYLSFIYRIRVVARCRYLCRLKSHFSRGTTVIVETKYETVSDRNVVKRRFIHEGCTVSNIFYNRCWCWC